MTINLKQMNELIEVLNLKENRDGKFKTTWGDKTLEGLRETIENILSK